MEMKETFSQIDQVGIIVRDMEKTIEYYSSFGVGPFKPLNVTAVQRMLYGKPVSDVKNIVRFAQMGRVQIELIQPVGKGTANQEFLDRRGEGINHLGSFVVDLDKEVAKLTAKGFKVIQSGKFLGGGGFAYFDTDKVGGVLFELIQWPVGIGLEA
ncbi:hypothetical protein ES708_04326 [subsurface metagenome]